MVRAAAVSRLLTQEQASVVAVLSAIALVVVDAGAVNVALPTIGHAFDQTPARTVLVVGSYQLALLMALLPLAQLGEKIGQRRLFIAGIATFILAALLCSVASNFPMLVAARFLQGIGGAAILALGISLLRHALGTERLGAVIAWNATNVALCSAAGPLVGALMLSAAKWQSVFLVQLPIAALALVAARHLPSMAPTRWTTDLGGMLLYVAGVAFGACAFALLQDRPLWALAAMAGAAGTFLLLVRGQRRVSSPLVPMDLLTNRTFRRAVSASVLCFVAQTATLLALPFHLHLALEAGALKAGLVLAAWPLAVASTSFATRRFLAVMDAALLCTAGGLVLAAGMIGMALPSLNGSAIAFALCAALCGIGFGLFQVPNNRSMFLAAPAHRSAAAGGLQGTARLIGQLCGSILLAAMFASPWQAEAPRLTFAVAAFFAVASALVSALHLRGARESPILLPDGS